MSVRAFELIPAIERLTLMSDRVQTEISCIECCGKNLYIGTDDCLVMHYVIDEKITPSGKTVFLSEKQGHKYLALKKPIVQLKAASALNRILVLCDNTLFMLSMFNLEPIVSGAKIKSVTTFCLNDNPLNSNPFSIEICVALKKRNIQLYTVTEDKMTLTRDVPLPDPAIYVCMDSSHICVALASHYVMVNSDSNIIQDLFPYDTEHIIPQITKISREEFLLSAPGALGMFASASGISQRPPLKWSENLVSVVYSHPYCLALNDEFITIHSILDQQQKQSIPFQGGLYLGEYDGKIFVSSCKEIYALVPIAVEKQIQALLNDKRVKEALELAKNSRKTGLGKEKFMKMYQRIQQQAGFIEFAEMHLDEAEQLLHTSQLDVRELISVYPSLLPRSSTYMRSVPPLHEIADIHQLCKGDKHKVKQYKMFLLKYLQQMRGTKLALGCQKEVDTALVALNAELCPGELVALVSSNLACGVVDCTMWLEKYGLHHALALLHSKRGDSDHALSIWTRIENDELHDESFPGLEFIVEYLSRCPNPDIVWKYADWLLEKNEKLGVRVFMERSAEDIAGRKMQPDAIVDYLARYPNAIILYLHHLVFEEFNQNEKYHTHLAVLYLDRVLTLLSTSGHELQQTRKDLQHMLEYSNLYRVQLLLGKVKDHELYAECAILYGKLEEHDKALRILIHKMRDFSAAESYCIRNVKNKDRKQRHHLYQLLLSIYLDPSNERRDSLVAPAVSLLNNNKADFDMIRVLQLIPEHWSIGLLSQFLTSSIRKSNNMCRTSRIEGMLARGENLLIKSSSLNLLQQAVILADDKRCAVCSEAFTDSIFVRYPNNILTHISCAKNKLVCPVTGKVFSPTCSDKHNFIPTDVYR